MKTKEIAQWAEVVSSVAILATLIVLIIDLRSNTEVLERQAAIDRANVISSPIFHDPRLAAASTKIRAIDGPNKLQEALVKSYQLTEEEAFAWSRHLGLIWTVIVADYNTIPDSRGLRDLVCNLMKSPDFALAWSKDRSLFSSPEFIKFVESCR